MNSKYNIESKVNCFQYGALLQGATGSLGLGGGGGGSGYSGGNATATSTATSTVSPNIEDIAGGGFISNPTINLYPAARDQKDTDINNPLSMITGVNISYIILGIIGVVFFVILFRR